MDARLRTMTAGWGVEMVLAFPVLPGGLGLPVIAAAGDHNRVRLSPARVFRHAVRCGASGVVIGHNHPADTGPSDIDRAVTRRLVSAGATLGIPLIAHVVSEPGSVHELVQEQSRPRPTSEVTARVDSAGWRCR